MPKTKLAHSQIYNLLQFNYANKIKAALSLSCDHTCKHQRDELDDNAGLSTVLQKPNSTMEAETQESFVHVVRKQLKAVFSKNSPVQPSEVLHVGPGNLNLPAPVSTASGPMEFVQHEGSLDVTSSTVVATTCCKSPKVRAATPR
jgi:hypothetical protein